MNVITRYGGALLAPVTAGFDPDARSYIARVEAADGQPLENGVRRAINQFVVGCKADGIWNSLKASCILAGARTLNGALVPLVGPAPTNFNFVSGDYNRKTGLVGDGSTKYLDTGLADDSTPQNSVHYGVYVSSAAAPTSGYIYTSGNSGIGGILQVSSGLYFRARSASGALATGAASSTGFLGVKRSSASFVDYKTTGNSVVTVAEAARTPQANTMILYAARSSTNAIGYFSNGRMAFFSAGESLDLALLDARVTTLVNAIGAALP